MTDSPKMLITVNNIEYTMTQNRLGTGSFGHVMMFIGNDDSTVAVKIQETDTSSKERVAAREFEIQTELSKLDGCDNIIKMLGQTVEDNFTYFVLEYASGKNLYKQTIDEKAPIEMVKQYFRMLIAGVKFLHKNGIVHRDIKPANLILTDGDILKIADFGKAAKYMIDGKEYYVDGVVGTRKYSAPELDKQNLVEGPPVDIFACGVTLLHMAANSDQTWKTCDDEMYRRWGDGSAFVGDIWAYLDPQILTMSITWISSNNIGLLPFPLVRKEKYLTRLAYIFMLKEMGLKFRKEAFKETEAHTWH